MKVILKDEQLLNQKQNGFREILDVKEPGEGSMSIDHLIEELDCYSESDFSVYQKHETD